MAKQAAVQVAGTHSPIGDGKREIHVEMHHDAHVVMCRVVAADGVDEGHIAYERVFRHVASEVKCFVQHRVPNHGDERH